ncbi:hypothetical protein H0H87_011730 [Tephrocybe sp. NHM501043]|nr:hypothetical protein H0H87_011730 [Tephrocybe sp. NHM501043]
MSDSIAQTDDVAQSSGTAVAPMGAPPPFDEPPDDNHELLPIDNTRTNPGQEQALETHEVIELQTFSERKVWIEDKIKFLETLPPIEVFAGLDAVRTSAEYVPGVPTSAELKKWIAEHDAIEKETEIFDRGELTKLRQLTKAATQRNLSPADTDVIELTLTTIYELDKLLHLLRDRSENLELLAIRLAWEESRIAAWIDRRTILDDVRTFLNTRVRWTASVYKNASMGVEETPGLARRSSIASLASANSEASVTSPVFSRGARFRLAEMLSHDAAQFAGRVTSLRHAKITVAGKILDKLIDLSRKPVPEELLDEQDKLEEQGITDMENLGKFVLNMVMQWRKADEIYVETMKDKTTAQNLFEEIETAKLHHPTARQSASFVSRADALIKRLSFRGNPISSTSAFPSPEHPLVSDQKDSNRMLAQFLSSEISATSATAYKVDDAAKAYRTIFEAVSRVEDLTASAEELSDTFTAILGQLEDGIPAPEGDGSPPDLSSLACLESTCHSAFLTLLPTILKQSTQTTESSTQVLRFSVPAMVGLDHPGIDKEFTNSARSAFRKLELLLNQVQAACETTEARCALLSKARQFDAALHEIANSLKDLQRNLSVAIDMQRWRQVSISSTMHPTTYVFDVFPPSTGITEINKDLVSIDFKLNQTTDSLRSLCGTLDGPVKLHLLQHLSEVQGLLGRYTKQMNIFDSIRRQAATMKDLHGEFIDLKLDIESAKNHFEARTQEVLSNFLVNGDIPEVDIALQANLEKMQSDVAYFVDRLPDRVPFVSQGHSSSCDFASEMDLEFGLPTLDDVVRTDSNLFAVTLSGQVEDLSRHLSQFHLARIAKDMDAILLPTTASLSQLIEELQMARTTFSEILSRADDTTLPLNSLLQDVEKAAKSSGIEIYQSFSQIRGLLQKMDALSGAGDTTAHEILYTPRCKAADRAVSLYNNWEMGVSAFLTEVRTKWAEEIERLELSRRAQELQAARDRAAAEQAKRYRLEQERVEREMREKLEQEQIAEALRQHAEEERIAAEQCRLEQPCAEAEENRCLEDRRIAKERCLQVVVDGVVAERAEEDSLELECTAAEPGWARLDERIDREETKSLEATQNAGRNQSLDHRANTAMGTKSDENPAGETRDLVEKDRLPAEGTPSPRLGKDLAEAEGQQSRGPIYSEVLDIEVSLIDGRYPSEKVSLAREASVEQAPKVQAVPNSDAGVTQAYNPRDCTATEKGRQPEQLAIKEVLVLSGETHPKKRLSPTLSDHPTHEVEILMNAGRLRIPHPPIAPGENTQGIEVETLADCDPSASRRMKSEQHQDKERQRRQPPEVQRKLKTERVASSSALQPKTGRMVEDDVFGLQFTPAEGTSKTKEIRDLQAQILAFRKRLRSMNINDLARPKKSSASLPDLNYSRKLAREFSSISSGVSLLPRSTTDQDVDVELRSLRTEIEDSTNLMKRVENLAHLAEDIQKCDAALSDLLEHIDSYPALPKNILSSSHSTLLDTTPEEQLTARLSFTRGTVASVKSAFSVVPSDTRAISEKIRILQTWGELEDMGQDILVGRKSRPASAISSRYSSGRNSSASMINARATTSKKAGAYSNLSVSSTGVQQRLLLPRHSTPQRAVSGGTVESQSRPVRPLSGLSSNRAVSGPLGMSVFGSTFSSRQRTLSNSHSTPPRSPSVAPARSRAQTTQHSRVASPTVSEASSYSRSVRSHTRSSTSMSTWARAPRHSLSSIAPGISPTPKKKTVLPWKAYVADPRNKLDVAVGDVVNQLPVGINIEGVAETWKDQSGKYWIGNQDPKLCFCRILRSQTVMVRVGGGWSELSKFIKDHFADSFRLLPESPPRFGASEEKWISSTTLLDTPAEVDSPPVPPRTPEPTLPFVPSFSLSTPNGKSPHSLHSASNSPSTKGSPLTPLQFIRRADLDNALRPGTPSKPPINLRPRVATTQNPPPARNLIWRP